MADRRFDEVVEALRESYPDSCVLWVDEVVSPDLRAAYEARVAAMRPAGGVEAAAPVVHRKRLFHGTRRSCVDPIVRGGFDSSANVRSAYGRGTYLACAARTSMAYAPPDDDEVSFMFVCEAAVRPGACVLGRAGAAIDQLQHDAAVDSLERPSIYVLPRNDAVLPLFVVAFHSEDNSRRTRKSR